jgi:hypothetical protein
VKCIIDKNSYDIVNITAKDNYHVKKRYPKLKVLIRDSKNNEIDTDDDKTIRNIIMEKNDLEEGDGFHLKVAGKFTPQNNKDLTVLTLEVDQETKMKLLTKKPGAKEAKLAYGGGLYKVLEDVRLKICYKCQGYNHVSAQCNKDHVRCKLCSMNHHASQCDRNKHPLCCPNCKSKNEKMNNENDAMALNTCHAAHTTKCSIYLGEIEKAKTKNI